MRKELQTNASPSSGVGGVTVATQCCLEDNDSITCLAKWSKLAEDHVTAARAALTRLTPTVAPDGDPLSGVPTVLNRTHDYDNQQQQHPPGTATPRSPQVSPISPHHCQLCSTTGLLQHRQQQHPVSATWSSSELDRADSSSTGSDALAWSAPQRGVAGADEKTAPNNFISTPVSRGSPISHSQSTDYLSDIFHMGSASGRPGMRNVASGTSLASWSMCTPQKGSPRIHTASGHHEPSSFREHGNHHAPSATATKLSQRSSHSFVSVHFPAQLNGLCPPLVDCDVTFTPRSIPSTCATPRDDFHQAGGVKFSSRSSTPRDSQASSLFAQKRIPIPGGATLCFMTSLVDRAVHCVVSRLAVGEEDHPRPSPHHPDIRGDGYYHHRIEDLANIERALFERVQFLLS